MRIRDKLRRYRRYLPYLLIPSVLLFTTPLSVRTHDFMDGFLDALGVVIAVCGQALRLWAWGANPKASGLRFHGPYCFIRHPLYVGNFLIATGLLLIYNVPLAYFIVLPPLALLYRSVAAAEEERLEQKWGAAYREYRAKVPCLLPWRARVLPGNPRVTFSWKQALNKDGQSIYGCIAGALSLEAYEEFLTYGFKESQRKILFCFVLSLLLGLFSLSFFLQKRKKTKLHVRES